MHRTRIAYRRYLISQVNIQSTSTPWLTLRLKFKFKAFPMEYLVQSLDP